MQQAADDLTQGHKNKSKNFFFAAELHRKNYRLKCSICIFEFAQISVSVVDVITQRMALQEPPCSDTVLV
uniref:Uncharacterized protein n=1 Tax=Arundo donax TaxID=35708 RepID=A0A0A9G6E1_ARUDO